MHNLVLLCKTYIKDLARIKLLKESIDRFNADKIPFYIVCPENDIKIIKNELQTGMENYELIFLTDEDIIGRELTLKYANYGWFSQQIVKLLFYRQNVCRFYVILDSDIYFIQNFYNKDFMYDKDTPYLSMVEEKKDEYLKIQTYLNRKGKPYSFVRLGQVFSTELLCDMEKNVLNKNRLDFEDLLKISPYEMQWYGEYYMLKRPYELYPANNFFKYFWYKKHYLDSIRRGETVEDFIKQGYLGILMQQGWIKEKIYKPPFIYMLKRRIREKYAELKRRGCNFLKNSFKRRK